MKTKFTIILILFFVSQSNGKDLRPYVSSMTFRGVIDFDCTSTHLPKVDLQKEIKIVLKPIKGMYVKTWGDRAVPFDLNQDGEMEYFVPLECGGTGNCDWGVFATNPSRCLGVINGHFFFVRAFKGQWPTLVSYVHTGADDGTVEVYEFKNSKYQALPGGFDVEGLPKDLPTSMQKVKSTCSPKRIRFSN